MHSEAGGSPNQRSQRVRSSRRDRSSQRDSQPDALGKPRQEARIRPPARGGVHPVRVPTPKTGPLSLVLENRYPTLGSDVIAQIFAAKNVVDFRGRSLDPNTDAAEVPQGVWIYRPIPDEPDAAIKVEVLARGDGWMAADKPAGLATMPRGRFVARTLTVALRRQEKNDDIVCAHRLDRATAGVVLAVTDPARRGAYQQLFGCGRVRKKYLAVASANLDAKDPLEVSTGEDESGPFMRVKSRIEKQGIRMQNVAGQPNSETVLRPASAIFTHEGVAGLRVWEVEPITGRTHQIRVHFAGLGAPIVGDPLYGGALAGPYGADEVPDGAVNLQLLAESLAFTDPFTSKQIEARSIQRLIATSRIP